MLQANLAFWYKHYHRSLPWRETRDPYCIWVSEVILQQTRVIQGREYYLRFVERFPDVRALAEASEQEVLALWQGLGYYSRARNMHAAANQIVDFHHGFFPDTYDEVRALKGIGDYTAAAVCSIAFNLPHAVVDGNVYRVLSRLFAIHTPVDTTPGKKEFRQLAQELLDPVNPGLHNQALMELGALICVPVNPDCSTCPLQSNCLAHEHKLVELLPVKSRKTEVKELYYNYLYIHSDDRILLQLRSSANNIWKNMYEFPLIEVSHLLSPEEILSYLPADLPGTPKLHSVYSDFTHILSHRKIHVRFYEIEADNLMHLPQRFVPAALNELHHFPLPRILTKYLETRKS